MRTEKLFKLWLKRRGFALLEIQCACVSINQKKTPVNLSNSLILLSPHSTEHCLTHTSWVPLPKTCFLVHAHWKLFWIIDFILFLKRQKSNYRNVLMFLFWSKWNVWDLSILKYQEKGYVVFFLNPSNAEPVIKSVRYIYIFSCRVCVWWGIKLYLAESSQGM